MQILDATRVRDAYYSPLYSIFGGVSRGVSVFTLLSESVGVLIVIFFVNIVFNLASESFHKIIPKIFQKNF